MRHPGSGPGRVPALLLTTAGVFVPQSRHVQQLSVRTIRPPHLAHSTASSSLLSSAVRPGAEDSAVARAAGARGALLLAKPAARRAFTGRAERDPDLFLREEAGRARCSSSGGRLSYGEIFGYALGMRIETTVLSDYKGMADAQLPWVPALVFFGPNDAGKTNVLEAIAQAYGGRSALRRDPMEFGEEVVGVLVLFHLEGLDVPGHPDPAALRVLFVLIFHRPATRWKTGLAPPPKV